MRAFLASFQHLTPFLHPLHLRLTPPSQPSTLNKSVPERFMCIIRKHGHGSGHFRSQFLSNWTSYNLNWKEPWVIRTRLFSNDHIAKFSSFMLKNSYKFKTDVDLCVVKRNIWFIQTLFICNQKKLVVLHHSMHLKYLVLTVFKTNPRGNLCPTKSWDTSSHNQVLS